MPTIPEQNYNPALLDKVLELAGWNTELDGYRAKFWRHNDSFFDFYYKRPPIDWNTLHEAFMGMTEAQQMKFSIGFPYTTYIDLYLLASLRAPQSAWLTAFARTFGIEETI